MLTSTPRARHFAGPLPLLCALLSCLSLGVHQAGAQTSYGSLSNFDVFNTTGQECHGFEIELEGLSKSDITFTFGQPYQRYGDPVIVEEVGRVYVRYVSPYDPAQQRFTATTPIAPAVITPTDGHACWTGGAANYPTSGCEHFGVGLARNPTATTYRWLVAEPNLAGALQPSGTKVSIPAPLWNVAPPQGGGAPVVQAVLQAEPPEVQQQYGDATWVKVFVTESSNAAELHHLVTDDPAVPDEPAETEMEWVILQAAPPGKKGHNELANEGKVREGSKSVTRRYEFYEYTGAYDPETHEVLCADGECNAPLPGELGNYLGAQMAALNLLEPGPSPTPTPSRPPDPTPTATPPAVLVGDCDGDTRVTVDEIVVLVNIALGTAAADACVTGIPSATEVDITLVIQAVNNALGG